MHCLEFNWIGYCKNNTSHRIRKFSSNTNSLIIILALTNVVYAVIIVSTVDILIKFEFKKNVDFIFDT